MVLVGVGNGLGIIQKVGNLNKYLMISDFFVLLDANCIFHKKEEVLILFVSDFFY